MKSLLDQNGLFLVCTFLVLSPKHTSPPATHLSVTTATSRELPEASIIHSSNMLFFSMCRIFLFVLNKTINVLLSHPTVCKAFLCNMTCFFLNICVCPPSKSSRFRAPFSTALSLPHENSYLLPILQEFLPSRSPRPTFPHSVYCQKDSGVISTL